MIDRLFYGSLIILACMYVLPVLFKFLKKHRTKKRIKQLASNSVEITPKEFLKYRKDILSRNRNTIQRANFEGVYIIHNVSKDLFYVGQAQRILDRLNQHFTGHGNGDVYADYKYGDKFTIRTIALRKSGFKTLNELERNAIETYDACKKGYNKTKGNFD